ncbi:MAG: nucleotidyltransferase domain-containing protein [Nitrososphaerota archaeon]|nr:nucleotidyltransferase domain-containing protein [Nitrososphaerota archaeon]
MQSAYDQIRLYKFSKKEKEEIIRKISKFVARDKRIKLAIVFGSLITRDYVRDVDLCICSNPRFSFTELLDLNARLELELGMPVDLVELENLPKNLQTNVLKNGVRVKG